MAANTTPIYPGLINKGKGKLTAANAARDGSGTVVTVFTAGANGSRVEIIRVKAIVTTTAGAWRFWAYDGTNAYAIGEIIVPAITVGAAVQSAEGLLDFTSPGNVLLLPSGWTIRAATNNAEAADVTVVGGDY